LLRSRSSLRWSLARFFSTRLRCTSARFSAAASWFLSSSTAVDVSARSFSAEASAWRSGRRAAREVGESDESVSARAGMRGGDEERYTGREGTSVCESEREGVSACERQRDEREETCGRALGPHRERPNEAVAQRVQLCDSSVVRRLRFARRRAEDRPKMHVLLLVGREAPKELADMTVDEVDLRLQAQGVSSACVTR